MIDQYSVMRTTEPVSTANLPPRATSDYQSQAPASPSTSMTTNPSATVLYMEGPDKQGEQQRMLPASSRVQKASTSLQNTPMHPSQSQQEIRSFDTRPQHGSMTRAARSPSIVMNPTLSTTMWADTMGHSHISGAEPRMFPGVVYERTRRNSMRQGSQSERDLDGLAASAAGFSKLVLRDTDENNHEDSIALREDPREEQPAESTGKTWPISK